MHAEPVATGRLRRVEHRVGGGHHLLRGPAGLRHARGEPTAEGHHPLAAAEPVGNRQRGHGAAEALGQLGGSLIRQATEHQHEFLTAVAGDAMTLLRAEAGGEAAGHPP